MPAIVSKSQHVALDSGLSLVGSLATGTSESLFPVHFFGTYYSFCLACRSVSGGLHFIVQGGLVLTTKAKIGLGSRMPDGRNGDMVRGSEGPFKGGVKVSDL